MLPGMQPIPKKELLKIQSKEEIERALTELAVRPNMLSLKQSHNAAVNPEFEWDSDLENCEAVDSVKDGEKATLLANSSRKTKR